MDATKDSTMNQNMCSEVEIDAVKNQSFLENDGSEHCYQEQVHVYSQAEGGLSMTETVSSQFSMHSESWDSPESPTRKRKAALNDSLAAVDISPIRKTLNVDFEIVSERTKNDYRKKAKEIMHSALETLVPEQEVKVENVLFSTPDTDKMLESVSSAYNSISSWGAQRQILSLLVQDYSYSDLRKHIPELSRYKYSAARKHAATYVGATTVSAKKQVREKFSTQQIKHFLDFIMSPAIMTDAPFGECTYKISSGQTLHVPKIILNSVRTRTVSLYLKYCQETEYFQTLSERTYTKLLEAIAPGVRKSMKELDTFAADGSQALENLKTVVMTLGQYGKGKDWTNKINGQLTQGQQYLKLHYKWHYNTDSEVPDHCCKSGLSSKEKSHTSKCLSSHHLKCEDCEMLSETLEAIEDALDTVTFANADKKDDAKYDISQNIRTIVEWNTMRTLNQERVRKKILDFLQPYEALIERNFVLNGTGLKAR